MISSALCNSYKRDSLLGLHQATDTYKIALIKPGAANSYGKQTTSYNDLGTDEATGAGCPTGGWTLAGLTGGLSGDTAFLDWDDVLQDPVSVSADGAVIYNDSLPGKDSVAVIGFGGTVTSTNGPYRVKLPSTGTGLIRWT